MKAYLKGSFEVRSTASMVFLLSLLIILFISFPCAPCRSEAADSGGASCRISFNVKPAVRLMQDGRVCSNIPVGVERLGNVLAVLPL